MEAARVVSTLLGAGRFPVAPGTFASLIAALLHVFLLSRLPLPWRAVAVAGVFALGVAAATATSRALGEKDPRRIVIDEVVGQWVALFLAPAGWLPVLAGFLFFRFFDILKPLGIRRLEALPSGWGIMADDAAAGLASLVLLQLLFALHVL
jgi:phosphatidylglycerophosphatase A